MVNIPNICCSKYATTRGEIRINMQGAVQLATDNNFKSVQNQV